MVFSSKDFPITSGTYTAKVVNLIIGYSHLSPLLPPEKYYGGPSEYSMVLIASQFLNELCSLEGHERDHLSHETFYCCRFCNEILICSQSTVIYWIFTKCFVDEWVVVRCGLKPLHMHFLLSTLLGLYRNDIENSARK